MEGVDISMNRNLSQSHPIFKLLAPHFLYLIAINIRATESLLANGSYFDQTTSVAHEGAIEIMKRTKSFWRVDVEATFPEDLKRRGVDDLSILRNYHSRNDALLLYNAIKRYVTSYVSVYYASDEDLLGDEEVQSWRAEMVNPAEEYGLGLNGVPGENGKFTTREQLDIVLAFIIYTCSVGHAMANFKMYDEFAFPPNYPSMLVGTPPKDKSPRTELDIVNALPSSDVCLSVLVVSKILSQRRTNALGDFEVNYIFDPKALEVVEQFRRDLKVISETIKKRNRERETPYVYLDPTEIPNSISI